MQTAQAAEESSLTPLGRVTSLRFGIATSQEIMTVSGSRVIEKTSDLSGPALGLPTESRRCCSCGTQKLDECEGHFGHFILPIPVYHPRHMQLLARILKSICLNCFQLKKKKKVSFVEEVRKRSVSEVSANGKGKEICRAINDKVSSSENEDPLLSSLIPKLAVKNFNSLEKKLSSGQKSKNIKFIKQVAGSASAEQINFPGKGKKKSFFSDSDGSNDVLPCSYCKDRSYPKIHVEIVSVPSCNDGISRELRISFDDDIPRKFLAILENYAGVYNKASRVLLPFEALRILRQMPETVFKKFGVKPESLIWNCLPVPPNCTKISAEAVNLPRLASDGGTKMLKKIINIAGKVSDSRGRKPGVEIRKHESKLLQSLCAQYYRSQGGPKESGDREPLGENGRNIGKPELLSKIWKDRMETLFLKKSSRFSARGVLSGDAYIGINEIGIPIDVAKGITIEEHVTIFNKKRMQDIIKQGLYETFIDSGGRCRTKEFFDSSKSVEVGEIVHRYLADGDIVIVNRPPTIHKHSIQALRVRIQPSSNFSVSPLMCSPFDADFDGDCIHIFVPQSVQSQVEACQILHVNQQLVDSHSGKVLLMLTRDTLFAASLLLSMHLVNAVTVQQLSLWALSAIPEPAIRKSRNDRPYWTGIQVLQMSLPAMFNSITKGLDIWIQEQVRTLHPEWQANRIIELILQFVLSHFGAKETLNVLNSMQKILTEWLSLEGISVGIGEVIPFHDSSSKSFLAENVNKCLENSAHLMKISKGPGFEDIMVPHIQNHVQLAQTNIFKCIAQSNSLAAIVCAGSGRSMVKVVEQTGFLGLQTYKGKGFFPTEWSNWFLKALHATSPNQAEINLCQAQGLIVSSVADGLLPHEVLMNSISTRETLFCKSLGIKEPGKFFKNLMACLRDLIICYDGTTRTVQGNYVIQFNYDCYISEVSAEGSEPFSEWKGENSRLKEKIQPGDPVGMLAATALANPAYKVLLDAVQRNLNSWHILKESLFHRCSSSLNVMDRTVILCLKRPKFEHSHQLDTRALKIKNHLLKTPLKIFATSFEVWYHFQNSLDYFDEPESTATSPFVGHVQLDQVLLQDSELDVHSLIISLRKSIACKGNPLKKFSDALLLSIRDQNCDRGNGDGDIQSACLHFCLKEGFVKVKGNVLDLLINFVYPKLLDCIVKGDHRIDIIRRCWSDPNSDTRFPLERATNKSSEDEVVIEATVSKREAKKRGDAWRVIQETCLHLTDMLNFDASIPYGIHEIYSLLGISAAYHVLLQRLFHLVSMMGSPVYRQHLVLIADFMSFSGNINGLSAAGYRDFLKNVGIDSPFSIAAMEVPLKWFEKAAVKGEKDDLSGTLAASCWGRNPYLGTGGRFDVIWHNMEDRVNPFGQLRCHEDAYDLLENIGMVPGDKDTIMDSSLDENTFRLDNPMFASSDVRVKDIKRKIQISNVRAGYTSDSWDAHPEINAGNMPTWDAAPYMNFEKENMETPAGWKISTNSDLQDVGTSSNWKASEDAGASSGWELPLNSSFIAEVWNQPDTEPSKDTENGWAIKRHSQNAAVPLHVDRGWHDHAVGSWAEPESLWKPNAENCLKNYRSVDWQENRNAEACHTQSDKAVNIMSAAWELNWVSSTAAVSTGGDSKPASTNIASGDANSLPISSDCDSFSGRGEIEDTTVKSRTVEEDNWRRASATYSFVGGSSVLDSDSAANVDKNPTYTVEWCRGVQAKAINSSIKRASNEIKCFETPEGNAMGKFKPTGANLTLLGAGKTIRTENKGSESTQNAGAIHDPDVWNRGTHGEATSEQPALWVGETSSQKADQSVETRWDKCVETFEANKDSGGWSEEAILGDWGSLPSEYIPNDVAGAGPSSKQQQRSSRRDPRTEKDANEDGHRRRSFRLSPEVQEMSKEIRPLVDSMKRILRPGSYENGERLKPDDQAEVLDKVLVHHPNAESKRGCGVDYVMIDNHEKFTSTRCFFVVRKDGTKTDFSYLKCLKTLVQMKYPNHTDVFIQHHLNPPKK